MSFKYFAFLAGLLVFSQTARADFDFMGGIGIHEGGDDVVTALFTDGTEETIQAGEFISFDLGVAWDMGPLEGRISGGYRYDEITADNGKLVYSRYTTTGLLLAAIGNWRFGGGATYHFNIDLEGSGVGTPASAEFDDAVGYIGEIDYYFNPKAYVGLQYTDIEYDRTTAFGKTAQTFDASSIGLVLVGRW